MTQLFPTLANTLKNAKNKSWRRCRLYFRCRMQCWWIFDFETNYSLFKEFVCKLGTFGMNGSV
jgi:hypothetical protein